MKAQECPEHKRDYIEYKCRYCCSVATFFCFGTTHFCQVRDDQCVLCSGLRLMSTLCLRAV